MYRYLERSEMEPYTLVRSWDPYDGTIRDLEDKIIEPNQYKYLNYRQDIMAYNPTFM